MKIKHIRWMAIVGLLAIFGLQYVWLVNTYKLAKESIQFRSNEVFKDASMQELFHRMEELKAELKKKYAVLVTVPAFLGLHTNHFQSNFCFRNIYISCCHPARISRIGCRTYWTPPCIRFSQLEAIAKAS